MTPCNSCENNKCGSCVAETLERTGLIRDAKFHCGCADNGHKNDEVSTRPKVKSMFSKVKDVDLHVVEPEVVED